MFIKVKDGKKLSSYDRTAYSRSQQESFLEKLEKIQNHLSKGIRELPGHPGLGKAS